MEKEFECAKWLRGSTYIAVINLINSVSNLVPFVPSNITTWISRLIMLATIFCMFQLASINTRYKQAGIFRTVRFFCVLIMSFFGSLLLTAASAVFSILAVYQEYRAHAELVLEESANLSRNWCRLFYWEVIAALLLSFGSAIMTGIFVHSEWQGNVASISGPVIFLLNIPGFAVSVMYILYLKKILSFCLAKGQNIR